VDQSLPAWSASRKETLEIVGPSAAEYLNCASLRLDPDIESYFGEHDDIFVVLKTGTKKTQQADIAIAQKLWSKYNAY
jgi:hypothetical protein